jgi:DNA-binding response OmpR family regulator
MVVKILLVDDNLSLLDQIGEILTNQRYIVETVSNGEEALDKLCENPFDLIILDIMMPKMDGFTALREMRQIKIDAPVLMLTAKGDSTDKVKGLDLGADDYLNKPFSMDELLARVRALLRRSAGQCQSVLKFGELSLDTVNRKVTMGGKFVELTPREFSILEFLLHNKDRVVTRFSLAEHVWGNDFDPFSMSNFMDVHMKNLRHKIGDTGTARIIRTVRGVGYIIGDTE